MSTKRLRIQAKEMKWGREGRKGKTQQSQAQESVTRLRIRAGPFPSTSPGAVIARGTRLIAGSKSAPSSMRQIQSALKESIASGGAKKIEVRQQGRHVKVVAKRPTPQCKRVTFFIGPEKKAPTSKRGACSGNKHRWILWGVKKITHREKHQEGKSSTGHKREWKKAHREKATKKLLLIT